MINFKPTLSAPHSNMVTIAVGSTGKGSSIGIRRQWHWPLVETTMAKAAALAMEAVACSADGRSNGSGTGNRSSGSVRGWQWYWQWVLSFSNSFDERAMY
jgi:hypothetical protein